jgi:hypothetical protein
MFLTCFTPKQWDDSPVFGCNLNSSFSEVHGKFLRDDLDAMILPNQICIAIEIEHIMGSIGNRKL